MQLVYVIVGALICVLSLWFLHDPNIMRVYQNLHYNDNTSHKHILSEMHVPGWLSILMLLVGSGFILVGIRYPTVGTI